MEEDPEEDIYDINTLEDRDDIDNVEKAFMLGYLKA